MMVSDNVAVWLLLIMSLSCSVGQWIWIGCRRTSDTSAWGTPEWTPSNRIAQNPPRYFSQSFRNNLEGRSLWFLVLLVGVVALLLYYLDQAPTYYIQITYGYACCWLTACVILFCVWRRIGKANGVKWGLLANFFIFGGLLSTGFSLVLEGFEMALLSLAFPRCDMRWMDVAVSGKHLRPAQITPVCETLSGIMCVLVPGLVEETWKSVWLFWRLRRSEADLPNAVCFGACSATSSSSCCGGWYKLAPTPYHVLLCALSLGAGFESMENVKYVFVNMPLRTSIEHRLLLPIASGRALTSGLHLVWTSLIGVGLARHIFLPIGRRPSLLAVVAPSMVLHGLYDYSLLTLSAVAIRVNAKSTLINEEDAINLIFAFTMLLIVALIGSLGFLGYLTGFRCRCWKGICCYFQCCCFPGFWAELYEGEPLEFVEGPVALRRELLLG